MFLSPKPDRGDPIVEKSSILARAQMLCMINPAGEYKVVDRAASEFEPGEEVGLCVSCDLQLNWATGLSLSDRFSPSNFRAGNQIANLELDEIAASELPVDRQIEQGAISSTLLSIHEEAHGPNLFLIEGPLRPDLRSDVP